MPEQPNVVFIQCDDRRFDTIRCLGNHEIHTPNIDALVKSGTAFTHAFNPGSTHIAVCLPSRAMLHSSRTLFHIQGAGEAIPAAHTTLGEAFRAAGYTTFSVGKWHNDTAAFHRSFSDAAEIFFGGMPDHWNMPLYHYDPSGRYDKTLPLVVDPVYSNRLGTRRCDHIHAGRHSTDIFADAAERFLSSHSADQPYLLYLSFFAPHDPRTTHQEFLDMYDPETIELPPNFMGGHPFENGDLNVRDEMLARFPRRPEEVKKHIAEYYAMLSHVDQRIGTIIEAAKQRGDWDNTIFVHCADHGIALGQHGLMGKQNLYDHSTRVPMIFAGPGVPKGANVSEMAYLMDIFPTLCDLCGVAVPESAEGMSLAPVMSGAPGRQALYHAYLGNQRGVRTERWKLIEYVFEGRRNKTQLFDLESDPWEMNNLAEDSRCEADLSALRAELIRLSYEWDDRTTALGQAFWSAWPE